MGLSQFDEHALIVFAAFWDDSNSPGQFDCSAPNPNGARFDNIICVNTDTIDHNVEVCLVVSGLEQSVGTLVVPAGQGADGSPSLDFIAQVMPSSANYLNWVSYTPVRLKITDTVTAGKFVSVLCQGGSF